MMHKYKPGYPILTSREATNHYHLRKIHGVEGFRENKIQLMDTTCTGHYIYLFRGASRHKKYDELGADGYILKPLN